MFPSCVPCSPPQPAVPSTPSLHRPRCLSALSAGQGTVTWMQVNDSLSCWLLVCSSFTSSLSVEAATSLLKVHQSWTECVTGPWFPSHELLHLQLIPSSVQSLSICFSLLNKYSCYRSCHSHSPCDTKILSCLTGGTLSSFQQVLHIKGRVLIWWTCDAAFRTITHLIHDVKCYDSISR